jgi:hypothetical protein
MQTAPEISVVAVARIAVQDDPDLFCVHVGLMRPADRRIYAQLRAVVAIIRQAEAGKGRRINIIKARVLYFTAAGKDHKNEGKHRYIINGLDKKKEFPFSMNKPHEGNISIIKDMSIHFFTPSAYKCCRHKTPWSVNFAHPGAGCFICFPDYVNK